MPLPETGAGGGRERIAQFHATHWSVVLAAADTQSHRVTEALDNLCRAYWYPLYAHARRQGFDAHESQDLTQAFFAFLIEKKALGKVDPTKGKFRSFLLSSMNNFLNNERDKALRFKRGGGVKVISLDAEPAEQRYLSEPACDQTPEKIFERRWANAVVEQVAGLLASEFAAAGHAGRFEILKDFLMGEPRDISYEDAARRMGISISAMTSAIHRARLRFRDLFRKEITSTVGSPEEVDEEIRYLLAALG
ncbi:MAG TPA: sigma-70 family RNA polymerase sigma factor [Verrucomicrobiae bacterium]